MYEESLNLPNFLNENVCLDVKNKLFVRQMGIGEHFLCLVKQYFFVLITRGIVAQQQLPYTSIPGYCGGLFGC